MSSPVSRVLRVPTREAAPRAVLFCLVAAMSLVTASASAFDPETWPQHVNASGNGTPGSAEYRNAEQQTDRDARLAAFRRAALSFRRAIGDVIDQGGTPSAAQWTNLGNASLQSEQLGPAVLAYRRALEVDPDHPEARQNLTHTRALLPTWLPRPTSGSALDAFFFWHRTLSQKERAFLAGVAFAIAVLLIAASIRWRQSALRNLAILPLVVWLALLASVFADSGSTEAAVITVDEVTAHSSDSQYSPSRFANPLPGGAEVTVRLTRNEWAQIVLPDGRDGWVPATALTRVSRGAR